MKLRFACPKPTGLSGTAEGQARYWLFIAFLCLVFLAGGGSRRDIVSLAFLRPIAVIAFLTGLFALRLATLRAFAVPILLGAFSFGLALVQLIPLPPTWWQALPGREVIVAVDKYAGLQALWRPLSMDPIGTRNALFSLFPPAALCVMAIQLTPDQRSRALVALLGFGFASAVLAGLQLGGEPDAPLYLYRVTNNGAAVGLFANRNHQALLLAMMPPILAYWASLARRSSAQVGKLAILQNRATIAVVMAILVAAMLLVTGSRSGLALGLTGLFFVPWLGPQSVGSGRGGNAEVGAARAKRRWWYYFAALAVSVALTAYALSQGQAEAISRLVASNPGDDDRITYLPQLLELAQRHWLFGTGFGSFEAAYKISEPAAQLSPSYLNHAHNDWLELVITGGMPAILLTVWLVVAIVGRVINKVPAWKQAEADAKPQLLAFVLLLQVAIASIGDYPLRTPIIGCLFMLALVVLFDKESGSSGVRSNARGSS